MSERIQRLKAAVEAAAGCEARHLESHPVTEMFGDKVVWEGVVESFALEGHPKADRCYAFSIMEAEGPKFTAVLAIPPADSPANAVRVAIAEREQRRQRAKP